MSTYCFRNASAMEIPVEYMPGFRKLPLPPLLHVKYRRIEPCHERREGEREKKKKKCCRALHGMIRSKCENRT